MNSEFRTRRKLGPGPVLVPLPDRWSRPGAAAARRGVKSGGAHGSVASGLGGNGSARGDQRVVFDLILGQLHVGLLEAGLERGEFVDQDLAVQGGPGNLPRDPGR